MILPRTRKRVVLVFKGGKVGRRYTGRPHSNGLNGVSEPPHPYFTPATRT